MASQSIPPAERIRELGVINADIAKLLASAGRAVNALTDRPLSAATSDGDDAQMVDEGMDSVEAHKQVFEESTKEYYTNLQAIVARLRRQAYALEEAGIIAAEPPTLSSAPSRPVTHQPTAPNRNPGNATQTVAIDAITNGGLGKFDVGWLNSRGNKVGVDKEAELVQEAKELLDAQLSPNAND